MIKVFSFVASCAGERSHTKKFSDRLAEAVRARAEAEGETVEYECMTGADVRVDYCRSCVSCFYKGFCPLDEADDIAMLKRKMLECDILFFGTPVYLWQMSGIAKSVIDRISYWAHRYELLGKPCVVFSRTDSSHGPEVASELARLLGFTGAVVANAGTSTIEGIEIPPEDTAERVMELYRDPSSGVTTIQQGAFLSRVIMVRKYFKKYSSEDDLIIDEMKVFRERGLDKYVLLKEAIEGMRNLG